MITRISLNILLLLSMFFLPWWITLGGMATLLTLRDAPEILIWGLVMDMLYGLPLAAFFYFPLMFTAVAVALFFISKFLKQYLVFYH